MAYFNEFPHTRSYDSDLGWLISHVAYLIECCDNVTDALAKIGKFIEDVENGDFPESVVNAFKQWMETHLIDLIGNLVKQVYFGLTQDGHFIAYIVESWSDINFNTTNYDIRIPGFDIFGHLVLSY